MLALDWIDGEPPGRGRWGQWNHVCDELATRPGEWARVASFSEVGKAYDLARHLRRYHHLSAKVRAGDVFAMVNP